MGLYLGILLRSPQCPIHVHFGGWGGICFECVWRGVYPGGSLEPCCLTARGGRVAPPVSLRPHRSPGGTALVLIFTPTLLVGESLPRALTIFSESA